MGLCTRCERPSNKRAQQKWPTVLLVLCVTRIKVGQWAYVPDANGPITRGTDRNGPP
ncbi:hypothetical protein PIB30_101575, partial [Stylosanthes scabra]|nr:hypothetical protein [Stylosanthes scabra]